MCENKNDHLEYEILEENKFKHEDIKYLTEQQILSDPLEDDYVSIINVHSCGVKILDRYKILLLNVNNKEYAESWAKSNELTKDQTNCSCAYDLVISSPGPLAAWISMFKHIKVKDDGQLEVFKDEELESRSTLVKEIGILKSENISPLEIM